MENYCLFAVPQSCLRSCVVYEPFVCFRRVFWREHQDEGHLDLLWWGFQLEKIAVFAAWRFRRCFHHEETWQRIIGSHFRWQKQLIKVKQSGWIQHWQNNCNRIRSHARRPIIPKRHPHRHTNISDRRRMRVNLNLPRTSTHKWAIEIGILPGILHYEGTKFFLPVPTFNQADEPEKRGYG